MNIFRYILDLLTWFNPLKPVEVKTTVKVLELKSMSGRPVYVVHKRAYLFTHKLTTRELLEMARSRDYFCSIKIQQADINFKIQPKVHHVKL